MPSKILKLKFPFISLFIISLINFLAVYDIWLIDVNGISTCLGSFYAQNEKKVNCIILTNPSAQAGYDKRSIFLSRV